MKIFFDTETSSKAEFNLPKDHVAQPHIMQLAFILTDALWNEVCQFKAIIKPNFEPEKLSPEAAAIHGITYERAMAEGMPIKKAMNIFLAATMAAHEAHAFNVKFDELMVNIESAKLWADREIFGPACLPVCEMEPMTNICKLPGFRGKYKWPKLGEAYRHAFKREMENAHDALGDVRAMIEIHRWRIENGI